MNYCMDTSALLDAGVRYYPSDTFPSLWTKMDHSIDEGVIIACAISRS